MQPLAQPAPAIADRSSEPDVRLAQQGDATAFERLYRSHCARVHGLCWRLSGDPDRAETLTQDVFVRAWRKLALFDGRSAFGTWLYRLAVNVVMEDLRGEARRSSRLVAMEDPDTCAAPAIELRPEASLDLDRAIRRLPIGARLVFVLHDVNGYPHEEIATLVGVSVGTSKSQLHRARRLLREALA